MGSRVSSLVSFLASCSFFLRLEGIAFGPHGTPSLTPGNSIARLQKQIPQLSRPKEIYSIKSTRKSCLPLLSSSHSQINVPSPPSLNPKLILALLPVPSRPETLVSNIGPLFVIKVLSLCADSGSPGSRFAENE
jgi:hypothetical protein